MDSKAPAIERVGQQICQPYSHRATSLLYPRHPTARTDLSRIGLHSAIELLAIQQSQAADQATRRMEESPRIPLSAQSVVEITVGVSPRQLLDDLVAAVPSSSLREFLRTVVSEPEVQQALTTPVQQPIAIRGRVQLSPRYPLQTLRRAAEMAGYWSAYGQEERAVLFVATILRGTQNLLCDYVAGAADLDDVMFTLVRPALHRLDDSAPRQACLLRLALGWGNADEVDAWYVPRLQEAVARALHAAKPGELALLNLNLC